MKSDKGIIANKIYNEIKTILEKAKESVYKSVNFSMVNAYWNIGRIIVDEEQRGEERAEYGRYLIKFLSKKLTSDFGKGFSITNLKYMRVFYKAFPIGQTLSDQLSWSHYLLLSKLEQENIRHFYFKECISAHWSVRELERQISSLLYERLTLSRDKKKVLEISGKGHHIAVPSDLVKDPYVLEFLGLKGAESLYEKELEQALIDHLQEFLLELGKGFAFVGRQKRITIDGDHFFIDLVFYNRLAKCFVLIDLKIGKLAHQDLGQMQMYVNFYKRTQMIEGENEPIGILLCSEKNDAVVKFTLPDNQKQIFASKYKLYLPTAKELEKELLREREMIETARLVNGAARK